MRFLYNIFIQLYSFSIRIASNFNSKAKLWVEGRKDVLSELKKSEIIGKPVIWVHTASLGEFEQGRPIIENLQVSFPDHKILLTFFSPSGYEVRKNYNGADYVAYLPIDSPDNAKQFIDLVHPQLVIFIKYEFWFNYINELYINKIPLIFASVIFRSSQYFFKPWGKWFAKQLNKISYLFVQNEESLKLLDSIKVHHADVSGDTRFDRVIELPEEDVSYPIVDEFKCNSKILMGGSTWPPGEKILLNLLAGSDEDFKLIIAPHMINKEHIDDILNRFEDFNPVRYSEGITDKLQKSKVLIIDSIGILSMLYRYAHIAYIGGGFGVGIHSLLEASTYGVPVIFGPNYSRFREAIDLKDNKGGFPIENSNECLEIFNRLMKDHEFYNQSSASAVDYVRNNAGATLSIICIVKEYIVAG